MNKFIPVVVTIFLALVIGRFFFGPKEIFIKHNCLLQQKGECTIEKEGVSLNFKVSPLPINPTKDLRYSLKVKGMEPTGAFVNILGHSMEMLSRTGEQRDQQNFALKKFLKGNEFSATRIFPLCTEKIMIWKLLLQVKGENKTVKTAFTLEVKKRNQ